MPFGRFLPRAEVKKIRASGYKHVDLWLFKRGEKVGLVVS